MSPTLRKLRLPAGALVLALASAACADRASPVAPDPAVPPPALAAVLECHVDVRAGTVVCGEPATLPEGARGLIVGGQNTNIRLRYANDTYAADTFALDITVENLIPQPMATANGTTPSAGGVRAFFHGGPTVTSGSGTMTVANADGTGTFTGASQPYHQYSGTMLGSDGILSQNEISSLKRWKFHMPSTVQTFTFNIWVSTDVPFENGWVEVTPPDPAVLVGGTRALAATGRTATGAAISGHAVTWSSGNTGIATVSSSGVVTGVTEGVATITATSTDNQRTGSTTVRVCPDLGLAVGGVSVLTLPYHSTFCLGGGTAGAEYTVMPLNLTGAGVALTVTPAGIVPVTGAPSPTVLADAARLALPASRLSALRAADAFERRRRERETAGLTPLIPAAARAFRAKAAGGGARRSITPGVPAVGALMPLNVESSGSCTVTAVRTGRVEVVGTHVIVMSDTSNPAGGLTASDYQTVADRFDTLVWPTLTASFGAPEDIDGNGRVIVFHTTAVNALTPAGSAPVSHGFTLRRDLFPTSSCAASNEGEMIYLAAADPSGAVNGNARSAASVKAAAGPAMGHELAHLVNASRHLYVNFAPAFEEEWLEEGLAQVAEELLFYAAAGKQPRQNLGFAQVTADSTARAAFLAYAEPNLARLRTWMRSPETNSACCMTWQLLRYAADRKGGSEPAFWGALVNSTATGYPNFTAAIDTTVPNAWVRDHQTGLYTDDAVAGVASVYTHPSWNFRSLYDALDYDGDRLADGYPLAVRNPADRVADTFTMPHFRGAYLRMGVAAGGTASVTIQSGGGAPPTMWVTVVRRK